MKYTSLVLLAMITLILGGCTLVPSDTDTGMISDSGTVYTGMDDPMTGEVDNEDTNPSSLPTGMTTTMSGALSDMVTINSFNEGDFISNPLMLTGTAPGNWFFEATAPITIVNRNGLIIGEGYITADNWMTTDIVPFSGSVSYTRDPATPYNYGRVIIRRSNPSGLPENESWIEIPVLLN